MRKGQQDCFAQHLAQAGGLAEASDDGLKKLALARPVEEATNAERESSHEARDEARNCSRMALPYTLSHPRTFDSSSGIPVRVDKHSHAGSLMRPWP